MSRYAYRDSSSQYSHLPWLSLKRPHCLHLSTTKVRQTLLLRSISSWRHDKHLLRGWGGVTAPQMQHSTWPTPTEGPAIAPAKASSEVPHNVGCMGSSERGNKQKKTQHSFNPVAAAAAAAEAAIGELKPQPRESNCSGVGATATAAERYVKSLQSPTFPSQLSRNKSGSYTRELQSGKGLQTRGNGKGNETIS